MWDRNEAWRQMDLHWSDLLLPKTSAQNSLPESLPCDLLTTASILLVTGSESESHKSSSKAISIFPAEGNFLEGNHNLLGFQWSDNCQLWPSVCGGHWPVGGSPEKKANYGNHPQGVSILALPGKSWVKIFFRTWIQSLRLGEGLELTWNGVDLVYPGASNWQLMLHFWCTSWRSLSHLIL